MKNPSYQRQQGAALLMMMLALIALGSALAYQYLGNMNQKLKRQNAQQVVEALAEAKENLLVFAESIPELYADTVGARQAIGYLPCPDAASLENSTTGSSGTCSWASGAVNYSLGRFPGQKLSGNPFFFSIHEKNGGPSLWYAVDDNYRHCGNGTQCFGYINPTTLTPSMTLDGNQVVAVIIIANSPVSGQVNGAVKTQQRDPTEITRLQWDEHLESLVTTSPNPTFISRKPTNSTAFNDQVIGITKNELDERVKSKVCSQAKINNWCSVAPNTCTASCDTGICSNSSGVCNFAGLPSTHWFKSYKWSDSNGNGSGTALICSINSGNVAGMNTQECP